MAENSVRQRCTDPKSRASASDMAVVSLPSPPMLAKYNSCRSVALSAASSSRFRPLMT
jgi:hypothetical protein